MCYTQGNIIFYFTHAIIDEELFSKYTDSCVKEYKLYDKFLDKISLETESSVSGPSGKDEPTIVLILHTPIPFIQNNSSSYFSLSSHFYKSLSLLLSPVFKKLTVKVEEVNNINSNVEI